MRNMKKVIGKLIPISGVNKNEIMRNSFELWCQFPYTWYVAQKNGRDDNAPFFAFLQKSRFLFGGHKTVAMFPYVFEINGVKSHATYGDFFNHVQKQINDYIDGETK